MRIKDERRSAVYDDELHLEAYRFEGIVQPFPAHFHEHYVLGLVERGASPFAAPQPPRGEIDAACAFMQRHFAERITLDRLCRCAHLSKSTLLRAFTREKGVTPYRYLEAVRIGEAKSS